MYTGSFCFVLNLRYKHYFKKEDTRNVRSTNAEITLIVNRK